MKGATVRICVPTLLLVNIVTTLATVAEQLLYHQAARLPTVMEKHGKILSWKCHGKTGVSANIDEIVRFVSDTDSVDWTSTTEALSGIGLTTDEQFDIFQVRDMSTRWHADINFV